MNSAERSEIVKWLPGLQHLDGTNMLNTRHRSARVAGTREGYSARFQSAVAYCMRRAAMW
jgi:hypothetical protein